MSLPQHTSHSNGRQEISTRSAWTGVRSRSSDEPQQPHVGNYRLLKTIGKGNFAKVKLARHILTGREVSRTQSRPFFCYRLFIQFNSSFLGLSEFFTSLHLSISLWFLVGNNALLGWNSVFITRCITILPLCRWKCEVRKGDKYQKLTLNLQPDF